MAEAGGEEEDDDGGGDGDGAERAALLTVEPVALAVGAGASSPRAALAGASPGRVKLERGLSSSAGASLSLGQRFVLLPYEERFDARDEYGAVMSEAEIQRMVDGGGANAMDGRGEQTLGPPPKPLGPFAAAPKPGQRADGGVTSKDDGTPMHLEGPPDAADEAPFKWVARKAQVALTTSPPHHLTTSPPHHLTTAPPHHLTTSPPHHLTTAPPHHLTTSPPHHLTTSLTYGRPGAGGGALRRALHQRRGAERRPLDGDAARPDGALQDGARARRRREHRAPRCRGAPLGGPRGGARMGAHAAAAGAARRHLRL
eukprot:scaffold99816_cov71-Phaeocystis_antarctica.AAC.6